MPSRNLSDKLVLHREKKQAAELLDRLDGFEDLSYVSADKIPTEVAEILNSFMRTDSVPQSRISDSADESELDNWVESLLTSARISTEFFLRTGMVNYPWLHCITGSSIWISSVRRVLGNTLDIVSYDLSSVVSIFDDEYEVLGFVHLPPDDQQMNPMA